MDIYQERIRPLFDGASETHAEIERKLGIPPKTINKWNKTPLKSYRNYIPQIASYFQVSTDYLLGNTDDPSPPRTEGKSTQTSELVSMEDVKAAFFHGADPTLSEEEMESLWEDARNYMMYKISQRSRKNKDES